MSQLWDTRSIQSCNTIVMPGDTIPAIFWNAVSQRASHVWMRQKHLGLWRSWTWQQTGDAVAEIGNGLLSLGFAKGDCASILANTVVEWVLADLAVLSAGGVSNGIYPTDAASQVQYLCDDSRTTILFVEDDEQLDKALEVRAQLPGLRKIVVFNMEGLRGLNDPDVISLDALRALGRDYARQNAGALQQRVADCKPEDLAILVYTSGTTGRPKGAMHLHQGLVFTVHGYNTLVAQDERDERMCFLPLCHIAERMGGEYFALYTGSKLNFVENPETIPENVREIAPTVFTAVPRVWEKFYSGVMISLKESGALQQAAYAWGIGVGTTIANCVLSDQPVSAWLKIQFRLAQWLVLNNVRKLIGIHRARFLVTGAAPISPDLVRWYMALGLPMLEVWGMTETCGASTGVPAGKIHRASCRLQRGASGPHHWRDSGARQERICRLPEPARKNCRSHRPRRMAAHRRRGLGRCGWLFPHHRPHEGHHHYGRREKRYAQRVGKRSQVFALHHRRGGHRRQASLPDRHHHDRPGERGKVCTGCRRTVQQLRIADPQRRSAGTDPIGAGPCEPKVCPC